MINTAYFFLLGSAANSGGYATKKNSLKNSLTWLSSLKGGLGIYRDVSVSFR